MSLLLCLRIELSEITKSRAFFLILDSETQKKSRRAAQRSNRPRMRKFVAGGEGTYIPDWRKIPADLLTFFLRDRLQIQRISRDLTCL